jgi:hypothetical protein
MGFRVYVYVYIYAVYYKKTVDAKCVCAADRFADTPVLVSVFLCACT